MVQSQVCCKHSKVLSFFSFCFHNSQLVNAASLCCFRGEHLPLWLAPACTNPLGPDPILVVLSLHSPGLKSCQHIRRGECRLLWSHSFHPAAECGDSLPQPQAAGHTLKGQLLQAPYSRAGTGDMGPQEEGQSSLAPYCTHGPRGHLSGLGGWGTEGPCPPH